MKTMRLFFALALGVQSLLPAGAAESAAAVIARAREYLGGERLLTQVSSLRLTGDVEVITEGPNVKAEDRRKNSTIELIFQRPGQQLMRRTDALNRETVGLSDYDAWTRIEPVSNPADWRMVMLDTGRIRRLQASTFDSLNFFSGVERRGGKVEVRGESTEDGVQVVKVAFIHPGDVTFIRTFDKKTGRLVQTETDTGETIREEGEQRVDGIRFPQKVVTMTKRNGVTMTAAIKISTIKVNEKFDPSIFEMPSTTQK